jgi:hypothetical protein
MMTRKSILTSLLAVVLLLLLAVGGSQAQEPEGDISAQAAVGTAFTYQGRLTHAGGPVNGTCNFRFRLYNAASGGTLLGTDTVNGVPVSDAYFGVVLNDNGEFGGNAFNGQARWLEIRVNCGSGDTDLSPRQPLTAAPYAHYALQSGGGGDSFWSLSGNSGTTPGTHFVGTTDNQALELQVNSARALRLEPNTTSPNLIGGYSGNSVTAGVVGATIGGGGADGFPNQVTANYGTIGGGNNNTASSGYATVGGGWGNTVSKDYATVGGGINNAASGNYAIASGGQGNTASGEFATVGGGQGNTTSGDHATVGGGQSNTASHFFATVGGGYNNTADDWAATVSGGSDNTAIGGFATVSGGASNTAGGGYSFAAGRRAKANHDGAFVWADSTDADFVSTRNDQFKVRASGGAWFEVSGSSGLNPPALRVESTSSNGVAIYARQTSSDTALVVTNRGTGDLIKAFGGTSGGNLRFRVDQAGNVRADGTYYGADYQTGSADFAEMVRPGQTDLVPGDVLVVGPDGQMVRSSQAYQTSVVGVYSTEPGFIGGHKLDEAGHPLDPGRIPLAVVGIVPVKASTENGPIQPGDLLVTSATPGHAMRADLNPPTGTVIGKALEGLEADTGVIQMLVVLQ